MVCPLGPSLFSLCHVSSSPQTQIQHHPVLLLIHLTTSLQFITDPCTSDSLCASSCCDFIFGKCESTSVFPERQGCDFGTATPNNNAAKALGNNESVKPPSLFPPKLTTREMNVTGSTSSSVRQAHETDFITGTCISNNACASGCCGFTSGKCEGAIVSQERQGCGFGKLRPN